MNVDLLLIDPQKDFCNSDGALFVPGAEEDSVRLAAMIDRIGPKLNDIHVTLDTHHAFDVAHPCFWANSQGEHPDPFTIVTPEDVDNGVWFCAIPNARSRAKDYIHALQDGKRYPHMIWPPHCLIGTPGACVTESIREALAKWEASAPGMFVDYVSKGSNLWSEHFSAVMAEVPDPDDNSTQLNTTLIQTLQEVDLIAISGQALSHCVANTVRDIADNFGEENVKKFVLLTDTTSNVPLCEAMGEQFVKDMTARGMQTALSTDFLA